MNSRTLSLWPIRLQPSSTTTSAMSGPVTLQSVGGTQAAVAPDQMTVQVIRTVSTPTGPQQQIIRMPVSAAAAAMTAATSAVTPEVNTDGTGILTVDTSAISTCSPASQPFQLHPAVSLGGATPPVSTASTTGSIRLPQTPMPLEQVWSQMQLFSVCFQQTDCVLESREVTGLPKSHFSFLTSLGKQDEAKSFRVLIEFLNS